MRLKCPNCGAQYEVPDEVIPQSGRDVQCSNCGDTWFEHHPDHAPPAEDEQVQDIWDAPDIEDAEIADEATGAVPVPDMPERRPLDSAVTDVLRAEAEREQAARAAESGSLETQPDLGLSNAALEREPRQAERPDNVTSLDGTPDAANERGADPELTPDRGRNLLPDIDEINSSLDSDPKDPATTAHDDMAETAIGPASSGFRRGFLLVLLIAVIGLLLYIYAPQLAQSVPALDGALAGYVGFVNGLRGWLDGTVGDLMSVLDGMSTEGS